MAKKSIIDPRARKVADEVNAEMDGDVVVFLLSDRALNVDRVPVFREFDVITGGGLPRGRIIEIFGPETAGKTTLVLQAIAAVQKVEGVAAFIDAEHALDLQYAKALGVDIDSLLLVQPDYGEQALQIVDKLASKVDLIVIDSVAALVPKAEYEGEIGDMSMGLQARMMSQACRKLNKVISNNNSMLIFVNQLRDKINRGGYGPTETTTGGRALRFYSSIRIEVRVVATGVVTRNKEKAGNKVKMKAVKNKLAPPHREETLSLIYGKGFESRLLKKVKKGEDDGNESKPKTGKRKRKKGS